MFSKILLAWGALVLCVIILGHSQSPDVVDLRRTSSLGNGTSTVEILEPDPLGIDLLMSMPDIEHTWEYLEKIGRWSSGYKPYSTYQAPRSYKIDGSWKLNIGYGATADLVLYQNRDVIFGRGSTAAGYPNIYVTGQILDDVLYLDALTDDMILYRCVLRIRGDYLIGKYYAFNSQGLTWDGMARIERLR